MDRAYSTLEIKSIDDDKRIIEGIASSPSTDRLGDIVEPKGATYTLPLPFLWQHNAKEPIGHVTKVKVADDGITVRVQLAKVDEPGKLKDRLDESWQMIKAGLVRGLSVGFTPLEQSDIKGTFGQRFTKWSWLELSAVTIPANAETTISMVKHYDTINTAAATGTPVPTVSKVTSPGASGKVKALPLNHKPGPMVDITEQIRTYESTRASKDAERVALMEKSAKEGSTLDAADSERYDTLTQEIKQVDEHIVRYRELERSNKAKAVEVVATNGATASVSRGPAVSIHSVKNTVGKGIGFARYAMAMAVTKGNRYEAAEYAKAKWPDQPEVGILIKAAVAAGTTTDATWAGPLAIAQPLVDEFLELLRPSTLIGKITGLRRVPFNISMPAQTAGGTYAWTGQAVAKPVSALAFSTVSLPFAKATGLIVISKELAKLSNPSAQEIVRNDMIAGMQTFLDTQFVDPNVAISANVSPASITNGVAGTAAGGTTEAFARSDLRALMNTFNTNNFGLAGVVLIMSESVAFTLGTMVNAVGQQSFPGLTASGGSILGIPVYTSNVVGAQIIAVHAPSVLIADDGQTEIDVSEDATLQMDGAPANPADATTVFVSMFQRNLIALRCDRFVTWLKARANTVQRVHTVAYV